MFSFIETCFLWYFVLINAVYTVLLFIGVTHIYLRRREMKVEDFASILHSNSLPKICFIVPMYNEGKGILSIVDNIINLTYRLKEIIIVNDGSEDNCMQQVIDSLEMQKVPKYFDDRLKTAHVRAVYRSKKFPDVLAVDKDHGKKSDAVNCGLNACTQSFFIVADADSSIDDSEFNALIRPILSNPDSVGIGAGVRVINGCRLNFNTINTDAFPQSYIAAAQNMEYMRSFLMRQGWNNVGGNFVIAGAFSIFQTELMIKLGGFYPSSAEDMEIVIRLHRVLKERKERYEIIYLPDPVSWTEAPNTWKELAKQRIRWHLGVLETAWYHKRILMNPRYGLFGLFSYPFLVFGEALEPLVEAMGIFYIIYTAIAGTLNFPFFILFSLVSLGFMFLYTTTCLFVEELSFRKYKKVRTILLLLLTSFFENIGYRQLNIVWRIQAFFKFLSNFSKIQKEKRAIDQLVKIAHEELPKVSSPDKEAYL